MVLIGIVLLSSVTGCSTITRWRQRYSQAQIDRIFSESEAKRNSARTQSWTETVRCGNDGVQSIIDESGSPYAGLIGAALTSRLTIAQQIDTGAIPEEELEILNLAATAKPQ